MDYRAMNIMFRATALIFAGFMALAPAQAQWQAPNHSVPVGRGAGKTGFGSAVPGAAGTPLVSTGASTDPAFSALDLGGAGVTGHLPNANLANPSTTVNGQTCTLGASCTIPAAGGWRTVNLRANNTPAFPSLSMDMTADYIVVYNPSTGVTNTVNTGLSKSVAINSAGPGGRDQSGAFTGGQYIWSYYIWGAGPGVSTVWSANPPAAGGPSLTLLSGYTAWAPAFPMALVTTATLLPLLPQGGSTSLRVRGNKVFFTNVPLFEVSGGGGVFISTIDMSAWLPVPNSLAAQIELDPEVVSSSGPTWVGFIPMAKSGDPFANLSVYSEVTGQPAAQNLVLDMPVDDNGHIYSSWDVILGTPTSFTAVFFLQGYSFNNGG